jgi:N-ethylmaleimide reductase
MVEGDPSREPRPRMTFTLWTPVRVGRLTLRHRLAMAPMTRSRATPDGVPHPRSAEYYAQRASIGLIVTEGVQPSAAGQGYIGTPGLHTGPQIDAWTEICDAVHHAGGRIFVQLMHTGRVAHPDNRTLEEPAVAPSAVAARGSIYTPGGLRQMAVPRALTIAGIDATVREFRDAAAAAIAAAADGVEVHAGNGYLLHQFLSDDANRRPDAYGGSVGHRVRFPAEVARAVADEIGADRTGVRISPGNPYNGIVETTTHATYAALLQALAPLGLAYLHVQHGYDEELLDGIRRAWPTALLLNRSATDLATRTQDLDAGRADVLTVGVQALANPDLVARLRCGAPLNEPDPLTFYGGDTRGFTDYPALFDAPA